MIAALEHCPRSIPLSAACSALSLNRNSVSARRAQARHANGALQGQLARLPTVLGDNRLKEGLEQESQ